MYTIRKKMDTIKKSEVKLPDLKIKISEMKNSVDLIYQTLIKKELGIKKINRQTSKISVKEAKHKRKHIV